MTKKTPILDHAKEFDLFERALIVFVETKLIGEPMDDPPSGMNACWLHSQDKINVPGSGLEIWVRLQCYRLPLHAHDGSSGVKLWTMFARVRGREVDHPLLHLYQEIKEGEFGPDDAVG